MIKEKVIKEIKKIETVVSTYYYCDLCNDEIRRNLYDVTSYKVQFKKGAWYPEGGSWEKDSAYFCDTCAVKIKKIFTDMGVRFSHIKCDG